MKADNQDLRFDLCQFDDSMHQQAYGSDGEYAIASDIRQQAWSINHQKKLEKGRKKKCTESKN